MNKKLYLKEYYLKNKDIIKKRSLTRYIENREEILKSLKEYKNKSIINQKNKDYRANNDKIRERDREYRIKNWKNILKKKNEYVRFQYKNNLNFHLKINLSVRLRRALKENRKSKSTQQLLGCSINELKKHLESKFESGMSWDNYGKWEIDHIRPCASFNLSDIKQQFQCFHYSNLQPLWEQENLEKSNKY